MHFTFWPGLFSNEGGHREITWGDFLAFVAEPQQVERKADLEGWSPVRSTGNRRGLVHVEAVSAIGLDVDETDFSLERMAELWGGFAGVIHTTHSHDVDPPGCKKYRVVLRTSRDISAVEYSHVWRRARELAAARGIVLDEAPKDPSRFWYVPGHRAGAPYAWCELTGATLDVDEALATAPTAPAPTAPKAPAPAPAPADRRQAMAVALGSSWPAKGRHAAQLALAGALRGEGFTEAEAVEFLCTVCRAAGDEDRPKREATVRHTWARPAGAALTGWTRLKAHIDPVVIDAARGALGHDAGWIESTNRRMAEVAEAVRVAGAATAPEAEALVMPAGDKLLTGGITWTIGGYDAELPPIHWQIDTLIGRGEVVMLVAHGNSLKTWLAYSLGHAVASGRPWLGKYVVERGRAGLADFENDDYEMKRRLKLIGVKDGEVGDRLLRSPYPAASFNDPETWISLVSGGFNFLSIDSFNAAAPETDENDARAAAMLNHSGRFANATSCTVVWIHHARKGSGGDRRETVRGSSALFAACDRIFAFDEPEKKANGVVVTTMRSIKDGAGKSPAPVKVELSDQGLRYVEFTEEEKNEDKGIDNRALVLAELQRHPAGVAKVDLINVMKGRREAKFEVISQLSLANMIVEFKDRSDGSKQGRDFVVLRRGVEV